MAGQSVCPESVHQAGREGGDGVRLVEPGVRREARRGESYPVAQPMVPPAHALHLASVRANRLRHGIVALGVERVIGRRLVSPNIQHLGAPPVNGRRGGLMDGDAFLQVVEPARQQFVVPRFVREVPDHTHGPDDRRDQGEHGGPGCSQSGIEARRRRAPGDKHADHHPAVPPVKERPARDVIAGVAVAIEQQVTGDRLPVRQSSFGGVGVAGCAGIGGCAGGTSRRGLSRIGISRWWVKSGGMLLSHRRCSTSCAP